MRIMKEISYCIFDPTGNITALVETEVAAADRPSVASGIMAGHPEVEQAGFIMYNDAPDADVPVSLEMAGGEFCGNAAICAAALYAIRRGLPASGAVKINVSGAKTPLDIALRRLDGEGECAAGSAGSPVQIGARYAAAVTMPPAVSTGMITLTPKAGAADVPPGTAITLPLVRLQGIDHIVIETDSGFFGLREDREAAESVIREWCGALDSDCLGLMFLDDAEAAAWDAKSGPGAVFKETRRMIPLVYVPGADTMFWENSCASGSAACGIWLANKTGSPVDVTLGEPAGSLRVESDPKSGRTVLHGTARMLTQISYK